MRIYLWSALTIRSNWKTSAISCQFKSIKLLAITKTVFSFRKMDTPIQNHFDKDFDPDLSAKFNNVSVGSNNPSSTCLTSINIPKIRTFESPKLNSILEVFIVQSETPSNFVVSVLAFPNETKISIED